MRSRFSGLSSTTSTRATAGYLLGIRTLNVLPTPGSLVKLSLPPSSSTNRWQMCRPSPVPSRWRLWPESTCSNARKIRGWSSGGMPMPVSATSMRTMSSSGGRTVSATAPRSVNLIALLARLRRIWLRARWSVWTTRSLSGISAVNLRPLALAIGTSTSATSASTSRQRTGCGVSSTLPDSILARSSRSLMIESRCLADACTVLSWVSCSSLSGPGSRISSVPVKPITAFNGVRSSWLMLARKRSLAAAARSSSTFLSCSARSKTLRSVTSRIAAVPGVDAADPLGDQQLDRLAFELPAAVAEQPLGLGVDQADAPVAADPDDGVGGRLQQPTEQRLHPLAVGHVTGDHRRPHDRPAAVTDRGDRQRHRHPAPALGDADALVVVDTLPPPDPLEDRRDLVGALRRRQQ